MSITVAFKHDGPSAKLLDYAALVWSSSHVESPAADPALLPWPDCLPFVSRRRRPNPGLDSLLDALDRVRFGSQPAGLPEPSD